MYVKIINIILCVDNYELYQISYLTHTRSRKKCSHFESLDIHSITVYIVTLEQTKFQRKISCQMRQERTRQYKGWLHTSYQYYFIIQIFEKKKI